MANRFPLIFNSNADQIQELASGDTLDLTGNNLRGAGIITATTLSVSGNVSIAGTLTYEDVTNVDSIGLITARSGVQFGESGNSTTVIGDADGIGIGTANPGDKLHIFSSTSSGLRLEVPEGVALISSVQANNNIANGTVAGELAIRGQSGISLSPDNGSSVKVRVTSAGILTCFGAIAAQGGNAPSGGFQLSDTSGTLRPRITGDGDNATVIRSGSATGGVKFNNFANSSELAVLSNSGSLGIGTTNPFTNSALHISRDTFFDLTLERTGGSAGICTIGNRGNQLMLSNNVDGIKFETGNGDTTERLLIDSVGNFKFTNSALIEHVEINTTARTGTQAVDLLDGMVHNFTTASAGTWTPNFRIRSTTSLNSVMSIGEAVSPVMIVAKGATTHFSNSIRIDGSSVTPEFLGGAPTAGGGAVTFDIYSYTIIKTADATFTAFCSVSTFE